MVCVFCMPAWNHFFMWKLNSDWNVTVTQLWKYFSCHILVLAWLFKLVALVLYQLRPVSSSSNIGLCHQVLQYGRPCVPVVEVLLHMPYPSTCQALQIGQAHPQRLGGCFWTLRVCLDWRKTIGNSEESETVGRKLVRAFGMEESQNPFLWNTVGGKQFHGNERIACEVERKRAANERREEPVCFDHNCHGALVSLLHHGWWLCLPSLRWTEERAALPGPCGHRMPAPLSLVLNFTAICCEQFFF